MDKFSPNRVKLNSTGSILGKGINNVVNGVMAWIMAGFVRVVKGGFVW